MSEFAIFWADALLRSSIQGGLVAAAALILFKVWKSAPAVLRVWVWRIVLLKFLFVLFSPIEIERGSVVMSTGSAAKPLLPLIITSLSIVIASISTLGLISDLWKVRQMRRTAGDEIVYPNDNKCEIRESVQIGVPSLVGLGRPMILIPQGLASRPAELTMAVEHELSHLRRKDLAWAWIVFAIKSVFAFHPLVLLAIHELHVATESACDDEAVRKAGVSRAEYGNLLIILTSLNPSNMNPSVAFASSCSKETLRQRVINLAAEPPSCSPLTSALLVAVLFALLPGIRTVPKVAQQKVIDETKVFSPAGKHPI